MTPGIHQQWRVLPVTTMASFAAAITPMNRSASTSRRPRFSSEAFAARDTHPLA